EYFCVAKSKYGKEYHGSVFVSVKEIDTNKFPLYLSVKDYFGKNLDLGSEIGFGHQLKVDCFSDNIDTVQVSWFKESGINRAKITNINNQLSVLEIPAFTSLDLGKYKCLANDSNGMISSNSIDFSFVRETGNSIGFKINGLYGLPSTTIQTTTQTLVKRDPPQAVFIGAKEMTVKRYDWVKIECSVENSEDVQFGKKNGILPDNSYHYKNISYFLILPNVQPKDSGYYECKTTNLYGTSSDTILLTVVEQELDEYDNLNSQNEDDNLDNGDEDDYDEFISRLSAKKQPKNPEAKIFGLKEVILSEGDPLEVVCQVNYSVNVELIHFGEEDYRDKVIKMDNVYSLKFSNVSNTHSGYYTCTAFNDYGIVRDHVYVNVVERKKLENWNGKPLVEIIGDEKIVVNEGESVKIDCKVLGADKVFFKDENDPSQNIESFKIDDIYSVIIDSVRLGGYFMCVGQNEYGNRSDYVYVTVESREKFTQQVILAQSTKKSPERNLKFRRQVPSNWTDIPRVEILGQKKIERKKGASYEIVCEAKGGRDIEFRSYYETWPDNFETENIGDIYKLKLKNLREEDSGFYQCFANNQKGHSFDYVQIIVHGNEDNNIDF
ncbi:Muscle M-line assembly unc-89, partial [Brachionus plicatilis]